MNTPIYFITDFEEVCKSQSIFTDKKTGIQRDKIFTKFCLTFLDIPLLSKQVDSPPLWDFFTNDITGVHLPNASSCRERFLDLIPNKENVYFIFEPEFSKDIYFFTSLKQLVDVLKDCYNFNFYIFDVEFSFLLSWEAYETLFAYGEAKKWLKQIDDIW